MKSAGTLGEVGIDMMRSAAVLVLMLACAGGVACAPTTGPASIAGSSATLVERAARDEDLVRMRLSAFEAGSCADVESGVSDPVRAFVDVIAHNPQGVVPTAAARCLVTGHEGEAHDEIARWLTTPGHKGLALVVLRSLEQLPEAQALTLGRLLLQGPYAELVRPRLARSSIPAVKTLALEVVR